MSDLPPAPDRLHCPVCGSSLASSRCLGCGADLGGERGDELWSVDSALFRLSARRAELVALVRNDLRAPSGHEAEPSMSSTAAPPWAGDHRPPPPGWAAPPPGWAPPPGSTTPPPEWAAGTASPATQPLPAMMRSGAPVAAVPAGGLEVSSILLGLGVALLVLAAIVFAAVSWSRIGAVGQGALLIGLTAATAFATDRAARRRLTGTAEALGVLTVVLAPLVAQVIRITVDLPVIDDRTWANWASWSWGWPIVLVVIGAAAMAFGRTVGVRSPRYLGAALVQAGPVIWLALAPMPTFVLVGALAAQAALIALGPAFDDPDRPTRAIWAIWVGGSVTTWSIALLVAVSLSAADVDLPAGRHLAAVGALAACASAAAAVAWRYRDRFGWSDSASAAAAAVGLVAIGRVLGGLVPDVAWWPAVGLVAAVELLVADRLAGTRANGVRVVAWLGVVIASAPVAGAALAVLGAATTTDEPWRRAAADAVEVDARLLDPAWVSVVAGAAALGLALVAARAHLGRRVVTAAGLALGALVALTVPALAGGPVVLVTGVTLATAVALAALAWDSAQRRWLAAGSSAALGLGVVWASPNPGLALVAGVVALGLGAAAVVRGVQVEDDALAAMGSALAAVAVVSVAGLSAWDLGADATWTWATVSVTAAAVLAALPLPGLRRLGTVAAAPVPVFDPSGPPSAWSSPNPQGASMPASLAVPPSTTEVATEVAAPVLLVAHLLGLVAIVAAADGGPSTVPVTLSLAVGVAALAAVAARLSASTARWIPWVVAAGAEALALVWFQLAEAEVATVEAYTLPLAALLGAIAWLAGRGRPGGVVASPSWSLEGPALAMAVVPTALLALGDPGVARQAIGLVAGAALLAAGAALRRRAPLDVGAAVVAVLGLQVLAPYAYAIPRWISLGTVGAVLVAMGATFEQRRRDLHQAKRRYSSLR